jgi:hypothetical protein
MLKPIRVIGSFFIIAVLMLSGGLSPSLPYAAADDGPGEGGGGIILQQPFEPPEKGDPKLDSQLNQLISAQSGKAQAFALEKSGDVTGDTVRVVVECLPGQIDSVTQAVGDYGVIETSYENLLQMTVPVSQLTAMAELPDISLVRMPQHPVMDTVVSEGVGLINADDWQAAGYRGAGVKIGILDGGFADYDTRQGEGEVPAPVSTHWSPSIGQGTSIHGTACTEVVYDIAPDAQYYLTNFNTIPEMGNAVNWLINTADVDVISCSVGWPIGGPGDGTGTICNMVNNAHSAGILWSQSIGNNAKSHWQGNWADNQPNGFLDFIPGVDESIAVYLYPDTPIRLFLKWNDPWLTSSNDYNLLLFDDTLIYPTGVVAQSENPQNGSQSPIEGFDYTAEYEGWHFIAVGRANANGNATFHLYTYPYPFGESQH